MNAHAEAKYLFKDDWFTRNISSWMELFKRFSPKSLLEVGSHEGRSSFLAVELGVRQLCCVDMWGNEEARTAFDANAELAMHRYPDLSIQAIKGDSRVALRDIPMDRVFDMVHIDGSHECDDVLSDLVLAFDHCKIGGLIAVDDYLWPENAEEHIGHEFLFSTPKMGIDAFTNCYRRKIKFVTDRPAWQCYFQRLA